MLCLAAALALIGCHKAETTPEMSFNQGVRGEVWLKPGYDASDMTFMTNPPDLSPRPLPEALVYLLRPGDTFADGDLLATAHADSLGRYELSAAPGTYRLAVVVETVQTVGRYIPSADSSGRGFWENALEIVKITAGRFTEQSFEIGESVPQ
ncbi:MAG: hypothetical protein GY867_00185 [bacterium]|nr:hypothetical protein [bacterium]